MEQYAEPSTQHVDHQPKLKEDEDEDENSLVIPQQISEILELFLYLCGGDGVNEKNIRRLGITCIINCAIELSVNPGFDKVDYVNLPLYDLSSSLINQHFDACTEKIEQHRRAGGRVLIHCVAGISRSVTITLAYLVRHGDMSLREAHGLIKRQRPIVRPNSGFWRQLIDYENQVRKETSVEMVPCKWSSTSGRYLYTSHRPNIYD